MSAPHGTPRQLFRMLDSGAITREEFREAMGRHVREIIDEMVEARRNPVVAWIEGLRNKRAATRLIHQHGEARVRELFVALSDVPDFPPASLLWNADQFSIPLHCFLRSRHEPVFRVLKIESAPFMLAITLEHGGGTRHRRTRESFSFARDRYGRLLLQGRAAYS